MSDNVVTTFQPVTVRKPDDAADRELKRERSKTRGARKMRRWRKEQKAAQKAARKYESSNAEKARSVTSLVPPPVTVSVTPATSAPVTPATRRRRSIASTMLIFAALALAAVGVTMNGWFGRSLGSTDTAGCLFLAIGVATDCVALVMPSCAAGLWQTGQRATALVGWAVWLMTFLFAMTAGIGFASVNIADVTMSRASRITPTVQIAQAALADAMAARDRECKGGVGKFCREREADVAERRHALDAGMSAVAATADPQTEAAIKIVAWLSAGTLKPTGDNFAMLRLVLLALLPQIGGVLLMIARAPSADRLRPPSTLIARDR